MLAWYVHRKESLLLVSYGTCQYAAQAALVMLTGILGNTVSASSHCVKIDAPWI